MESRAGDSRVLVAVEIPTASRARSFRKLREWRRTGTVWGDTFVVRPCVFAHGFRYVLLDSSVNSLQFTDSNRVCISLFLAPETSQGCELA